MLVVYFTRTGNTEVLAETVHSVAGGDLVRIVPVDAYPADYNECLEQVQEEQRLDIRPDITLSIDNIHEYDTIILGYPIWYGTIPTPVVTFLTSFDFSDKTIMPFCTSGGSGISGSITKITSLCPDSKITSGLRGSSSTSAASVASWLESDGLNGVYA